MSKQLWTDTRQIKAKNFIQTWAKLSESEQIHNISLKDKVFTYLATNQSWESRYKCKKSLSLWG